MKVLEAKELWYSQPPDLSICDVCEDVIYSEVYKSVLQFGEADELNFSDTTINICKSCFELWQSL